VLAHPIDRRGFGTVLFAVAAGIATRTSAKDTSGLEGTWGGVKGEITAQVIIAGGSVIGCFWRKDYVEVGTAKFSADGRSVAFGFHGGDATLTRTGEATASLDVREGSQVTHLDLKRD
jgi:hypothetical protein